MIKKHSKWAMRRIKNGRVKIYGRWYVPNEYQRKYTGELDGLMALFAIYPNDTKTVYFWGSEEKTKDIYHSDPNEFDGRIYWLWWNEVSNDSKISQ